MKHIKVQPQQKASTYNRSDHRFAPVPITGATGTGAMPLIETLDPYNDDYTAIGYDQLKTSATTGDLFGTGKQLMMSCYQLR